MINRIENGIEIEHDGVKLYYEVPYSNFDKLSVTHEIVRGKDVLCYDVVLYSGKEKPDRLEILEKNSNGFDIAEKDLKARGPGDLFGVRQSGLPQFALADLYEDSDILRQASECADEVLRLNPGFYCPEERRVDYSTI